MEDIYKKQIEFQKLLENDTNSQEFKNQMFLGLFEEVTELMRETPFKSHKKNQVFNKDKFVEECVDVQVYLINLLLSAGVTWEEFEKLIRDKQIINFKRQDEGY